MKFSWGVILLLIQISAFCQAPVDSILAELDEVIKNKEYFVAQKQVGLTPKLVHFSRGKENMTIPKYSDTPDIV
jgi:uncharacterized membrane protein YjfL (UPF0719 family)